MLIDGRTLAEGEELDADVCIVGAGPAGIVLALELLGSGLRICLLESGDRQPATAPGGESVGYPYFPLDTVARRAFGGTSHVWGSGNGDYWHSAPLDRLDFETRPGIPHSGWPFTREELVPFYERATPYADSVPFATGSATDTDAASKIPVRPGRLVSSFFQFSTATFTQYFDTLVHAPDVALVTRATVAEIVTESDPRHVSHLHVFSAPGRAFTVRPRIAVLAAGGIENPRLLLLSNGTQTAGLANGADLVGRYFMEHLTVRSGVVTAADPAVLGATSLYAPRELGGGRIRPVLRLHEDVTRTEGLLNVAFLADARPRAAAAEGNRSLSSLRLAVSLRPRPDRVIRSAWNVAGDLVDVIHTRYGRATTPDAILLQVQAEQEPNPRSRITLGDSRDAYGLRMPRLDWRLSELDRRSIRRTQELLGEELRLARLGHVEDLLGDENPPALVIGIHHHLGTTRMDASPERGVVGVDGRVHGVDNLYVTGSSVFPTSGWANPTLTVLALAIRLADHLRETSRAA